MLTRYTRQITALIALAMVGGVCVPSALASKKKPSHKRKTTKPKAPAGVTKAQVLVIIRQYLAAHPSPAPPPPPTPPADVDAPPTTYTAGSGLKLASNMFSFDPAVVQARETASCATNQFLRGLGADGSPFCSFALTPATGTNSSVTLSATRQTVANATASAGGHQLVFAQVAAHRTNPGTADAISCVLNDLTSAPGTDYGPVVATFPNTGASSTSYVDLPLQSLIPTNAGDTVAVSCTGGAAGYVVDNANIALLPLA